MRHDSPSPAGAASPASLPLSQLLHHTAEMVAAVRAGRSLSDLLTTCPPPARPGTQALSFHVMRWMGGAQAARERLALESRLRLALAQGHLMVVYQPQVDIATGRILGAEALVRWNDPQEGLISPARFIPVAETSGVIGPLGEWVLREVCRQGQQWRAEGLPDLTLAVNVSPRQFLLTDLAGCASGALADSGFPAELLELEVTETALAERTEEEARQVLTRLRGLGLRIAVDDFGTGYSSLAQLKRFPIDVLKIDQGFIRDIPQSEDDMAISAAIIAMGHSMGLSVLAEGVETEGPLAFLRERGCDAYQGYLCSRPVPADEFVALLRAQAESAAAAQS